MKTSLLPIFASFVAFTVATTAHAGTYNTKHPAPPAPAYVLNPAYVQNPAFARFEWISPETDPQTSINHIVVSIPDQCLYAYRGAQLVAWSDVSSGKPGHDTPTGSFTVSEKDPDHHSSLYDDASMPFFMRLTDGGVGLHAGILPGYPASHGCVRLPSEMARELFQHVESGTPVEITSASVKNSVAATTTSMTGTLAQN